MVTERNEQQHYVALQSPPDDVNTVHELLQQVWVDHPDVDVMERFRFETALVELSGNVFEHADDGGGLACTLEIVVSAEQLIAEIADTGIPLERDISTKTMPDEFAESGRGLALIHALVDELTYVREKGMNRWHLVRNLPVVADGQAS